MIKWFKRISLFLIVNFLVLFTVNVILSIFQIAPYLSRAGINYTQLLIFCFIWGMVGAFISLLLSKPMAKWMMGVKIVHKGDSYQANALIEIVSELAYKAGLSKVPEVGIFQSPMVNAFATGATKNSSLVAVSSGLLEKMDTQKLRAIIGHEIAHIANGDMVTMTLLQGVVNAFVMFLARALAFVFSGMGNSKNENGSYMSYFLFVILFEFVFMLLGSMVVAAFSRFREYRADKGGAILADKESMIAALESLKTENAGEFSKRKAIQAFMINTKKDHGLMRLFATHPPLEDRIKRLQETNY